MYVVTTRALDTTKKGLALFGQTPNELGPNELRLVAVTRRGGKYQSELLADQLSPAEIQGINDSHGLALDPTATHYASLRVACELMEQARKDKRHVLIYVHGYNNDMADILATAQAVEALYPVIVVPFSWPANGGGPVTGTVSYLDDKRDARVSMDALNRFFAKVRSSHELLTHARRAQLWGRATSEHQSTPGAVRERYAELLAEDCEVTVNLMCHSMGNYVLKYALGPSGGAARELVFDNVSLIAADTNNPGHEQWVERIQVRNRLYITINEDDHALGWSRRKPGEAQLERLGHYLKNLIARNARYVDVTGAPWVRNDHSYFKGKPAEKNAALRAFFTAAFTGGRGETELRYLPDINAYRLK